MPSRRAIKDSEDEERPPDDGDGRSTDPDEGPAPRKGGKAPRVAGRSTWQRFKAWFRDFRLYIYVAFFAASFLLFLLGILSIWAPRMLGPGLEGWFRSMGSYNSYLFFFGLVCIVTAAYLFFALLAKLAEFRATEPFRFRPLPGSVFETALQQHAGAGRIHCRTLDRLHLAAMTELDVARLMTHDAVQARAARSLGFEVVIPAHRA